MKTISLSQLVKSKYLMIIIIFLSTIVSGQETIQTEFITVADGLSSPTIRTIMQDSYGLLWIGTSGGLHQYDGYEFRQYKNISGNSTSLFNDNIWSLAEDKDQNIWVGTDDGIAKYNRSKNEFKNYDFTELLNAPPIGGRVFNFLIDSKNRMWAAVRNYGVLLYNEQLDQWDRVPIWLNDSSKAVIFSALVMQLAEDKNGKIWAGYSNNGLSYYNDEDSAFVPTRINNQEAILDFSKVENTITSLYVDLTNTLWITCRNGIYKYDQTTNEMRSIEEYDDAKLSLGNYMNKILQDQTGNIWIANNYRGILKFDGISDDFTEINIDGYGRLKDGTRQIYCFSATLDKTGIIWFATTQGIMKYDANREPFINYKHEEGNKNSISSNQVFGLLESKIDKGKIFVCTTGGLNVFDQKTQSFRQIKYKILKDQFGGSTGSIAEDDDGSLLLGTWGDGLINLDKNYKEVNRYTFDPKSFGSLSDDKVRVIKKDNEGNYWVGTNNGLNLIDAESKKNKRIGSLATRVYPQELYDIAENYISKGKHTVSINKVGDNANLTQSFNVIRPRKYLVISGGEGTANDNLLYDYGWIVNSKNDTIWGSIDGSKTYKLGGADKNRLRLDIVELKPGSYKLRYKSDDSHSYDVWNAVEPIYPQFWGISIVELDDETEADEIQNYLNAAENENLIEGNDIRSIHISNNIVWIGTDKAGLNKLNLVDNTIITYSNDKNSQNTLSNNSVKFIHEDQNGILWLATNLGLNKFDPVKETFKVYTEDDGLPTNYIASILPGEDNVLWLSTINGISKMVTDSESKQVTFVNYDTEDGIEGMAFNAGTALKAANGQYFFGSDQALTAFTPGNSNTKEPDLIFSDLKIFNKSVKSYDADENPLETSLLDLEKLDLTYDQNDLTFSFAALHYSNPNKNLYAHKLIGYDKEWVFNNKREATYTNLDPGEYTFSIKGSNRDGVWSSKDKSIKININPPWWFTTWAYIGYGLFLIGGVFLVDQLQRRRLLTKTKERMKIQDAEHRAEAAELQAKAAEAEKKAMESENLRKSKELEEARQLQLSMLPKSLPNLPNLDIAVYMKTATEVGGDYYDFHVGMDGVLTVVLGDATGHGMKAGTMVTTTKSLFNVLAPNPNIVETFHEMTRCLKLMQLEKLSMCMSMLKIAGSRVQMSSAGMPPIFIYKKNERVIEEHVMQGMPLGTMADFPYIVKESNINPGDTILMMSDGFPELLNDKSEAFGYKRVRNLFEENSVKTPEDIIGVLKNEGVKWTNNAEPDDDVTFVVIKVK